MAKSSTGITDASPNTFDDFCNHRVVVSWVGAVLKGGLHVISIYLIDTVGLNEANKMILKAVAVAIKNIKGPWVIA